MRADAEGALESWLGSSDETLRMQGVEIVCAGAALHGDRVAELLRLLDGRGESLNALLWVARPPALGRSRALFDRVLDAVRSGALSDRAQDLFFDAAHFEVDQPEWAVELLTAWLAERPGALTVTTMRIGDLESREYGLIRLAVGAGRGAPVAFVRALAPYIIDAMKACAYGHDSLPIHDLQFGNREPQQQHPDVGDALQSTMAAALRNIGDENPEVLDELLAPLLAQPYETAQWLAYQGFIGAGAARARQAADVLLEDQARLESGYQTNPFWTTRELLLAIAEHLDQAQVTRLESVILTLAPAGERTPGYASFTLLSALPEARLAPPAARRLAELREQIRLDQPEPPPPSITLITSDSPVDAATAQAFSDDEWLAAMREHVATGGWQDSHAEKSWRLSQVLGEQAKRESGRFAALALRMDATFDPAYLAAVLQALADPSEPVPSERLYALVRHAAALGVPQHGRWIGWPLRPAAAEEVPDDIIELLVTLAVNAADPADDDSAIPKSSGYRSSGDFVMAGRNSARGQAANVLARLISMDADGHRAALVGPSLNALAGDASLGVRAMVADVLTACLMHARPAVIAAVPPLLDTDDRLLATSSVQNLRFYLVPTDLELVLVGVDRMLASRDESVREAGGAMAAYIALEFGHADRLNVALRGDVPARVGVARLSARRLPFAGDAARAESTLRGFFNDESPEVRAAAADVALALRGQRLRTYEPLLKQLIGSPAFTNALPYLEIALEEAPDDTGELLGLIVTRFLEEYGSPGIGVVRVRP